MLIVFACKGRHVTKTTTALTMVTAILPSWSARAGFCFVRQPEAGQCHARKAHAEFLQRRAARDRLSRALGEFIELVIHTFPFFLGNPIPRSRVVHVLIQHGLLSSTNRKTRKTLHGRKVKRLHFFPWSIPSTCPFNFQVALPAEGEVNRAAPLISASPRAALNWPVPPANPTW